MDYWVIKVFVRLGSGQISSDEMYISTGARLVSEQEAAYLSEYALAEGLLEASHKLLMTHYTRGYSATLSCRQVGAPSKMLLSKVRLDSQRAGLFVSGVSKRTA